MRTLRLLLSTLALLFAPLVARAATPTFQSFSTNDFVIHTNVSAPWTITANRAGVTNGFTNVTIINTNVFISNINSVIVNTNTFITNINSTIVNTNVLITNTYVTNIINNSTVIITNTTVTINGTNVATINPTAGRLPYKSGTNSFNDSALFFIDTNTVGAVEVDTETLGVTNLVTGGVVQSFDSGAGYGYLTNVVNGAGVLTNDGVGNLGWVPSTILPPTMNPTDGYVPYRSNATAFADSHVYNASTNEADLKFGGTNAFAFQVDMTDQGGSGNLVPGFSIHGRPSTNVFDISMFNGTLPALGYITSLNLFNKVSHNSPVYLSGDDVLVGLSQTNRDRTRFLFMPATTGAPTNTPAFLAGYSTPDATFAPVYDNVNSALWVYNGRKSVWEAVVSANAAAITNYFLTNAGNITITTNTSGTNVTWAVSVPAYSITNYFLAAGTAITLATNITGTNVTWTVTGTLSTTINTTDAYLPARASATTFTNSPLYTVQGTNIAHDGQMILGPGTTNVIIRNTSGVDFTNSAVNPLGLRIKNGSGTTASFTVTSGGFGVLEGLQGAQLSKNAVYAVWDGGNFYPSGVNGNLGLGTGLANSWTNIWLSGVAYHQGYLSAATNYQRLAIYAGGTNDLNHIVSQSSGDAGNPRPIAFDGADIVLTHTHTPASSAETNFVGAVTWDASFLYVWTATNVNKRVALTAW